MMGGLTLPTRSQLTSYERFKIYLNNALLGFVPAPGSPKNLVNDPFEIESRDFNNDGNLDLAVQLSSAVFTFLGDGTGAFPTNLQLQFPKPYAGHPQRDGSRRL